MSRAGWDTYYVKTPDGETIEWKAPPVDQLDLPPNATPTDIHRAIADYMTAEPDDTDDDDELDVERLATAMRRACDAIGDHSLRAGDAPMIAREYRALR